jgi:hypothetical protein
LRTQACQRGKEEGVGEIETVVWYLHGQITYFLLHDSLPLHINDANKLTCDKRHVNREPLTLTENDLQKLLKTNGNESVAVRIQAIYRQS